MVGGSPDGSPVTYHKSEGARFLIPSARVYHENAARRRPSLRAEKANKFL